MMSSTKSGPSRLLFPAFEQLWILLLFCCSCGVEAAIFSSEQTGSSSLLVLSPSPSPSSPPPLQLPTNASEAAVLLTLRNGLGIRSRYWPKKTDPCTVWTGIVCQAGRVVSITLTGLRRTVTGAMRPVFALDPLQNLTSLQVINSSRFSLPGSIPTWFGSLATLQTIDFTSCSISGSLPSSLGNLLLLQTLALANNSISGGIPSSFGNLSSVTFLDLSFNQLSGSIPTTLSYLSNLKTFNASFNELAGGIPPALGNLPKLTVLSLGGNAFGGSIPPEFGNLTLLNLLDLSSNMLSGQIPTEMARWRFLSSLNLSNNSLNGSIPGAISNCINLQVVLLDYNSLTGNLPTVLASLSNLLILGLSNNLFYGMLPFGSANFTALNTLDVSSNYLDGTVPEPFIFAALFLNRNCLIGQANQRNVNDCITFYSDRGLPFAGPNQSLPLAPISSKKNNLLAPILGGVFGGLGLVFVIVMLVLFVLKRQKRSDVSHGDSISGSKKSGPQPSLSSLPVNLLSIGESFSYAQLQQATSLFSVTNLLKAGHSGDLYQGSLEGGVRVVVKRIDLDKFRRENYVAELEIFSKASHTRLVPLLGHCLERENEKLLVYKYMPGRDLGYALHRKVKGASSEDSMQSLDWITRLKIAIGAAEGLTYLHHECSPPLVHRDIQSSSILLDDKFEVRLGSLSEACVAVGDSHQGVISRILRRQQTSEYEAGLPATCAHDVYCFGKVLLELVSGKLGISGSMDPSRDAWLEWALAFINIYDKESMNKVMDPSLIVDEDLLEEVWAMAIIAKSCLNPKPSKRPLMRYILKALENPLKVVREDTSNGSTRLRTSSHGSWNAALFGSWRHSSSEATTIPGTLREEYLQKNNSKHPLYNGSQGSGGQGEVSQRRPGSSEIFPEPIGDESIIQAATVTTSDKQDS